MTGKSTPLMRCDAPQRLLALAEQGDPTALRLWLEPVIPPLRERPLQFELPRLETPAVAAIAAITAGLDDGSA